ncbi:MAG: hypothetical protein R2747_13045 [Pyrinomonadaceae bacterium]
MIIDILDYTISGRERLFLHNQIPDELPGVDFADSEIAATHALFSVHEPNSNVIIVLPTDTLQSIINQVINFCHGRGKIKLLRMNGHGDAGVFLHGTLTTRSVRENLSTVRLLRDWFDRSGNPPPEVQLLGCWIGEEPGLIRDLAMAWNVPVSAGTTQQQSNLSVDLDATLSFEDMVVVACPNGQVQVGIPNKGPRALYAGDCQ